MPSAKNKSTPRDATKTKPLKAKRVKKEIKKATKKLAKLLRLRDERRKRKNQEMKVKVKDKDGKEKTKKVSVKSTRLQGITKDSNRAKNLQSHIQKLKNDYARLTK